MDASNNPLIVRRHLSVGRFGLKQKELRLARLERLLHQRSERERPVGNNPKPRPDKSQSGFTLIELLIVLAVASVILSLGLSALARSLRDAAVDQAVADIARGNGMARQLSMQQHDGDRLYGLRLHDDPSDGATVTIIQRQQGRTDEATDSDGKALYRVRLPASVILWHRDRTLRSDNIQLEWFFQPHTGALRALDAQGRPTHALTVGCRERRINRLWDVDNHSGTAPGLATGDDDHPGLHISNQDKDNRIAFGVFSSGVFFHHELTGDT